MKMRTLGRHHKLLQLLYDGEFKRRTGLKEGLGSMDAHSLQALLERGLVDRVPRDLSERGWYIITSAGKKAYEVLESIDPFPEEMPDEYISSTRYHPERGTTKRYYNGIDAKIAWVSYHWVEVDCPMNPYWTKHFSEKVW